MNLTTLEDVKLFSDPVITGEDFDDLLTSYIDSISTAMAAYCNRSFDKEEYTDLLDGGSNHVLTLNCPVREIKSIYADNGYLFGPDSLVEVTSYQLTDARTGLIWGPWRVFFDRAIKVTYVAGFDAINPTPPEGETYTPLPSDLILACKRQVLHDFKRRKDVGLVHISFPNGSITKPTLTEFLPQVEQVLDRYRLWSM